MTTSKPIKAYWEDDTCYLIPFNKINFILKSSDDKGNPHLWVYFNFENASKIADPFCGTFLTAYRQWLDAQAATP